MNYVTVKQIRSDAAGVDSVIDTEIRVRSIKTFYPRNEGKPGTRLNFEDGGGFSVSDSFDEVFLAAERAGNFLRLTRVDERATQRAEQARLSALEPVSGEVELEGEDDGLVAIADAPEVEVEAEPVAPVAEVTTPVGVNADAVRCFYSRRESHGTGTRLTFSKKSGLAVKELVDEIKAMVRAH